MQNIHDCFLLLCDTSTKEDGNKRLLRVTPLQGCQGYGIVLHAPVHDLG